MIKYQTHKNCRLPITIEPLKYGKLIIKIDELNLFIVQVNRTIIALINESEELNHIKIFKGGDFMFEFKDRKVSENIFIRTLNNRNYCYKNNELTNVFTTRKSIIRINNISPLRITPAKIVLEERNKREGKYWTR